MCVVAPKPRREPRPRDPRRRKFGEKAEGILASFRAGAPVARKTLRRVAEVLGLSMAQIARDPFEPGRQRAVEWLRARVRLLAGLRPGGAPTGSGRTSLRSNGGPGRSR